MKDDREARRRALASLPKNMQALGIVWYRNREHYERCKKAFPDQASMLSYENWFERAEHTLQTLRNQGTVFHLIELDLDELMAWCRSRGVEPDIHARNAFTALRVAEVDKADKPDAVD